MRSIHKSAGPAGGGVIAGSARADCDLRATPAGLGSSGRFAPRHVHRFLFALLLLALPLLGGCFDYRGLDVLEPVAGMLVDIVEGAGTPHLQISFHIIDIAKSGEEESEHTRLITTEGETIQECVFYANQQIPKDMYFGNAEILVVSEAFAKRVGLAPLLEEFIRDFNIRDTMLVIISREETAKALVEPTIEEGGIVSYLIAENLDWQKNTAKSVTALSIFEVYENIMQGTSCVALPAYRFDKEADPPQPTGDGIAYFVGDKLAGYLEETESEDFLYTIRESSGRILVFFLDGDPLKRVTLLLHSTKPKRTFEYDGERMHLGLNLRVEAELVGMTPTSGSLDQAMLMKLEAQANAALANRVADVIALMQQRGFDPFGFGTDVYRRDLELWQRIGSNWMQAFQDAEVRVDVDIDIRRTGLITSY